MFNIDPDPTFTAPVKISRPGLVEPIAVNVTFRHKNKLQVAAWVTAAHNAEAGGDNDELLKLLDEVVVEWDGMIDRQGEVVPYTPSNLAKIVMAYVPARGELYRAYVTELTVSKNRN